MPTLPPELATEIRQFFEPFFRREIDRVDRLSVPLGAWDGYSRLTFEGSTYDFSARIVHDLPGEQLKDVLRSLTSASGEQEKERIADFCTAVDQAEQLLAAAAADSLRATHQSAVRELSSPQFQLDRRFVQLTLLLDQGPQAQGVRFVPDAQKRRYDSLATLLEEVDERALVLLGRPGSGKTTLLKRLQLKTAWAELAVATGKAVFFVPLNTFRGPQRGAPPPPPREWLAASWASQFPRLDDFETFFAAGRLLLLLDGLNEIPHGEAQEYRDRVDQWRDFVQHSISSGNTFLFSCRSLDYSASLSSEAVPVRQVRLEPLALPQIEAFLRLHLGDDEGAAVYDQLQGDEKQLQLFSTPFFLRLLAEQVTGSGEMPAGQAALLTGFVRRTLHREVVYRRHRLFDPGTLLSADDVQQVIDRAWDSPFDLPREGLLIPKLAALAFAMQDSETEGEASQVRIKEKGARDLLALPQARDLIAAGIQLNVLDKDVARRELLFTHQLVQEYFAARVLARTPQPQLVLVPWRADEVTPALEETLAGLEASDPLPLLPTTGWEETTILAAAMTPDTDPFVADLMPGNLPLAARCAAAVEVRVSPQLVAELQQALIARIGDPQADLRARIAAAQALGELGDPRFERRTGAHGEYLRPPLASIAGGDYTIGDDASAYDDEKPAHPVQIAAFKMGLFPVTNAEYGLFMQAGGYDDGRWWETEAAQAWRRGEGGNEGQKQSARDMQAYLQDFSDDVLRGQQATPEQIESWLWLKNASAEELEKQYDEWYPADEAVRQPAFWDDSSFNHPAQPVVGVSWYEARAYCAWLSAQTGKAYGLPSEVEWEAAARGFEGRAYAYGAHFDAARCNTFETHIRRTTPVGVFPGGVTAEGIADLSGNIWEWTTTVWGESVQRPTFGYPYVAGDGREELGNALARRVVRGGSWLYDQIGARSAYRYFNHPASRLLNAGFRVVVRRPPSQNEH
jgi:formylglycine-generating enzyme required for sulfatase activity